MNRPQQQDLKEGVLVVLRVRSGKFSSVDHWCRVTKITPKGTVTVVGASKEVKVRPPYHDLRVPSGYEIALRKWSRSAPAYEVLQVYRRGYGEDRNDFRLGLDLLTDAPAFAEQLAKVESDIQAFRTWYASKPVAP